MEALLDAEHDDDYVESDEEEVGEEEEEDNLVDDEEEYDLEDALQAVSDDDNENYEDSDDQAFIGESMLRMLKLILPILTYLVIINLESKNDNKRKRNVSSSSSVNQDKPDDVENNGQKKQKKGKSTPNNFSQVKSSYSEEYINEHYPKFKQALSKALTVSLHEGEMLFIPAGWFHEVKSLGKDGHIALNYWFHPPDQMDFDKPYSSEFWRKDFNARDIQWK